MNEELETLCQVQKIDTKIIENEKKRAIGPQRIEEMQTELTRTREKIAKEKEIMEELEKERRKKETGARRRKGPGQEGRSEAPRSEDQQGIPGDPQGDRGGKDGQRQDGRRHHPPHGTDRGAEEGQPILPERA